MKNSDIRLDFIRSFLQNVNSEYPRIKFRCEYNELNYTYIIETIPLLDFSNNERYLDMEYEFTDEFERKFPGYSMLFVSSDSITKVTRPILEVGYFTFEDFKLDSRNQVFDLEHDVFEYNSENNFILAA